MSNRMEYFNEGGNTMNQAVVADPLLSTDFIQEMAKQMRAIDSYGTYDGWPVRA